MRGERLGLNNLYISSSTNILLLGAINICEFDSIQLSVTQSIQFNSPSHCAEHNSIHPLFIEHLLCFRPWSSPGNLRWSPF